MLTKSIVRNLSRDIKKMIWINTSLLAFAIPLVLTNFGDRGMTTAIMTGLGVLLLSFGNVLFVNTYFARKAHVTLTTSYREMRSDLSLDELTGVYNRRAGMARLTEELSRSQRNSTSFCLAMVDIDHFKRVNDMHGHLVGDFVLRHVASSLRSGLRDCDVIIRFGGEEFLIMLPETSRQHAEPPLDRIRQKLSDHTIVFGNFTIALSISIGITDVSPGEKDIVGAIDRADKALYSAKRSGRNRVVCNSRIPILDSALSHN